MDGNWKGFLLSLDDQWWFCPDDDVDDSGEETGEQVSTESNLTKPGNEVDFLALNTMLQGDDDDDCPLKESLNGVIQGDEDCPLKGLDVDWGEKNLLNGSIL